MGLLTGDDVERRDSEKAKRETREQEGDCGKKRKVERKKEVRTRDKISVPAKV